jgi:hypothetical protein
MDKVTFFTHFQPGLSRREKSMLNNNLCHNNTVNKRELLLQRVIDFFRQARNAPHQQAVGPRAGKTRRGEGGSGGMTLNLDNLPYIFSRWLGRRKYNLLHV